MRVQLALGYLIEYPMVIEVLIRIELHQDLMSALWWLLLWQAQLFLIQMVCLEEWDELALVLSQ